MPPLVETAEVEEVGVPTSQVQTKVEFVARVWATLWAPQRKEGGSETLQEEEGQVLQEEQQEMQLPEEVEGIRVEQEVSEVVLWVQQRGRELGQVLVVQVRLKDDFHSVEAEERRPLRTVSFV